MSVKSLIARFEAEKAEIQSKVTALQEREALVDLLLKELGGASGGTVRKTRGKRGTAVKPKARKARAGKAAAKGRKKKGGFTVREAIVKTVAAAKISLAAGEIIKGAEEISGGAVASIRTQINALSKAGEIEQVPFEGRGFKYQIPKAKPKPPAKKEA